MTAAAKTQAWSTSRVMHALREKYPIPTYAFLAEVADGTGWRKDRTADAIVMSCWPSRGLHLIGVEVKVSRPDWVKELADPSKAESICKFCDYWYVAAGSADIVRDGELPPTWGLMVPKGGKLVVKREAPALQPLPLSREFLASLLRQTAAANIKNGTTTAAIGLGGADVQTLVSEAREQGYKSGETAGRERAERNIDYLKHEFEALKKNVERFEEASGVKIDRWNHGEYIGEAVRFVLGGGIARMNGVSERVRTLSADLARLAENYDESTKAEDGPDA